MAFDRLAETKSVHRLAFGHYLRTGQRLTNREWLARQERKFNPYHDELGRFTSPPGVTVSWGNYGSSGKRGVKPGRRRDTTESESGTSREEDSNASELPRPKPKAPAAGFRSELVRNAVPPQTSHADTYFELNRRQTLLDGLRREAGPNPDPVVKADLDDFQKRLDTDRSRLDARTRIADRQISEILRAGLAPIDVGAGLVNIAEGDAELRDYLSASAIVPIGAMARQVGKTRVAREVAEGAGRTVTQLGGPYWKVRKLRGYHSHHIPAKSVSSLRPGEGPSIAMLPEDHMRTASQGNGRAAEIYRQRQADLIAKGDFRGAQKMDIDDIRSKFGDKYDDAIEQALKYTRKKGF